MRRTCIKHVSPNRFVNKYVVKLSWLLVGSVEGGDVFGSFAEVCVGNDKVVAGSPTFHPLATGVARC